MLSAASCLGASSIPSTSQGFNAKFSTLAAVGGSARSQLIQSFPCFCRVSEAEQAGRSGGTRTRQGRLQSRSKVQNTGAASNKVEARASAQHVTKCSVL